MISIKRFGCASLPPSRTNSSYNSLMEKTAKRENATDANIIFLSPVLLYFEIDNEDSKIDRTTVPAIRTISVKSIKFMCSWHFNYSYKNNSH